MKAIIEVDVPEHQIGQEVSIYFKDTMMIKGVVQEPTPNDDYFRKMAGVVISQLRTDRDRLEDELAKREQEPSGDLISRQAVLDGLKGCICEEWIKTLFATMVKQLPSVNPKEPSVEFVKTEESNDNDTKYLNINVSDDEVKRNPDIVRLCSDVGMLEYMKPETGHWVDCGTYIECFKCGCLAPSTEFADGVLFKKSNFCPDCGCKMIEPQEEGDKE